MLMRRLPLVCLLLASTALPLHAQTADTPESASLAERQAKAEALLAEGAAKRSAAKDALNEANRACQHKILVNPCRNRVYQEYVSANREGMRLEIEGRALQRTLTQERLQARDQQRAAELSQRSANLPQRQSERAAARQADETRRTAILADKEAQAREGAKRKAEAEKRLAERQAAHAAKVAEKKRAAEEKAKAGR